MESKKRISAIIMIALLFVTLLFSYTYITENEHHDCSGDKCPICMEIEAAMQTISGLKAVLTVPFIMALLCTFAHICTAIYYSDCTKDTLISLKVELWD